MTTDVQGSPARAHAENCEILRNRLTDLAPAKQHTALLDVLKGQISLVVDSERAGHVEARAPWRRLGVYREVAQRLRDGLAEATGLRLPATVLFDYPTPHALAEYLRGELTGAAPAAARDAVGAMDGGGTAGTVDDPVAVVGIGCRLPGGVDSPEDLWRLVDEGRDVIAACPRTGDGTWRGCTTRIRSSRDRVHPVRRIPLRGGEFDPGCSGSGRARRWRWIRSSG